MAQLSLWFTGTGGRQKKKLLILKMENDKVLAS